MSLRSLPGSFLCTTRHFPAHPLCATRLLFIPCVLPAHFPLIPCCHPLTSWPPPDHHPQAMLIIHPDTLRKSFKFEPFLRHEFNFGLDPDRPQCPQFQPSRANSCPRGTACPYKHVPHLFHNKIVCKHWLRGLCKKNNHCEFLHEYNLRRMPECIFYAKNGYCTQAPDCLYLHIDPAQKIPECVNYKRGFCPDGPKCGMRHVRRVFCPLYLTGFCPKGPNCENTHPRFENVPERLYILPDKTMDDLIAMRNQKPELYTIDFAALAREREQAAAAFAANSHYHLPAVPPNLNDVEVLARSEYHHEKAIESDASDDYEPEI